MTAGFHEFELPAETLQALCEDGGRFSPPRPEEKPGGIQPVCEGSTPQLSSSTTTSQCVCVCVSGIKFDLALQRPAPSVTRRRRACPSLFLLRSSDTELGGRGRGRESAHRSAPTAAVRAGSLREGSTEGSTMGFYGTLKLIFYKVSIDYRSAVVLVRSAGCQARAMPG